MARPSFIRYTKPEDGHEAEINRANARIRQLESDLEFSQASQALLQNKLDQVQIEEEQLCAECEDLCALTQEVADSDCDVRELQSFLRDELCGFKWPQKFNCNGLGGIMVLMREVSECALLEREYKAAVALHNLAFCKSQNVPAHIDGLVCQIREMVCDLDGQIDPRCLQKINQALAFAENS